jgi:hypothetical protein
LGIVPRASTIFPLQELQWAIFPLQQLQWDKIEDIMRLIASSEIFVVDDNGRVDCVRLKFGHNVANIT